MSELSTSPEAPVVHIIKTWLSSSHRKIESFWVGAQWDKWARYELFMALEEALPQCLVTHSMDDFFQDSDEEVDILLEPREDNQPVVAIKLRCEKVNENEGSYERFRDQMDADMTKIQQELGGVQSGFEGAKLLLVGFGGEPSAEDADFRTQSPSEHFMEGEVHCWIMKKEYPSET